MENNEHTRLGALLLEGNLIQEEQLERCLELQALIGGSRPLGQILIEQDVISREELDELLELQQRRGTPQKPEDEPIEVELQGVERFMLAAVANGATEMILTEGKPVMLRLASGLRQMEEQPLQSPDMWQFLMQHMGPDVLDRLAEQQHVSREFHLEGIGRGRMTAFRHFDGACVVVRLHPESVRPLADIGIAEALQPSLQARRGLMLLTGQAGSGVTSTMGSLLAEIVEGDPRLVIVLDENQEYELKTGNADVIFRRVGRDTTDYETGLEAAIRENPDVLAVADVSSPRSFDLVLRAAEGGCLVIAALNAKDIQSAVLRGLNFYPSYDVQRIRNTLASVLLCVLRTQLLADASGKGHVMATELLACNPSSRELIRNGELNRLALLMSMEEAGDSHSLDACLEGLHREGKIKVEDGFRFADDKARFLKRVKPQQTAGA